MRGTFAFTRRSTGAQRGKSEPDVEHSREKHASDWYPEGAPAFFKMLDRWREQGDFEGLVLK
jgi:hypothetical protein